jgi:replication initiation protein RepC
MRSRQTTTPFGKRRPSLTMVTARTSAGGPPFAAITEKWKVLDNLRDARSTIGISDRALTVLQALLTFCQHTVLTYGPDLIVFPSNRKLALRANGMPESTLRRHLTALVHAGLIIRRDSPNGKRFARKGQGGQIDQAFGFDISPLVARAPEFEQLAKEVRAIAEDRRILREEITLLRRDISKTVAVGLDEKLDGPWDVFADRYKLLGVMPSRNADQAVLEGHAVELRALWQDVDNCLSEQIKIDNRNGSAVQSERHQQNSKTDSISESEYGLREGGEEKSASNSAPSRHSKQALPLNMVLQACPDIAMYTKEGMGKLSWSEFTTAANVVRRILRISESCWAEAKDVMGVEDACVVVAGILQKGETIRSAGAYLRHLTDRARKEQFSVWPFLMALFRARRSSEQDKNWTTNACFEGRRRKIPERTV